jgi:hypothetical protein
MNRKYIKLYIDLPQDDLLRLNTALVDIINALSVSDIELLAETVVKNPKLIQQAKKYLK